MVAKLAATHTWTIVVAAGAGTRFGGSTPKQFVEVAGRRIVDWALAAAAEVSDGVVVVVPANGGHQLGELGDDTLGSVIAVEGGDSRSASVRRGLAAVPDTAGVIVVHDAARPLASVELFDRVIAAVHAGADAAVPTIPVVDTLQSVTGEFVDRDQLVAVQTPQAFGARSLRQAHESGAVATDDASLVAAIGGKVQTVLGERWNLKVTDPTDDVVAEAILADRSGEPRPSERQS